MTKIVLAITGASGAIYGIRLLEEFNRAGIETHLIISSAARQTIRMETSISIEEIEKKTFG